MALIKKEVKEVLGIGENELISKKTYIGGEDIIKRILCSIWTGISKVSTNWLRNEKRAKGK